MNGTFKELPNLYMVRVVYPDGTNYYEKANKLYTLSGAKKFITYQLRYEPTRNRSYEVIQITRFEGAVHSIYDNSKGDYNEDVHGS